MSKRIPSFDNYFVTESGSVFDETGRLIPTFKTEKGYHSVSIKRNDGKWVNQRVHRLVLITFIGLPPKGHQAAHLDGNKNNNSLANLKWCTSKENHSHKKLHGTEQRGEKHSNPKLTDKEVLEIREQYSRTSYRGNSAELATTNVSRLVLMTYDRLPRPKEQAAHLDGNKLNNHISNLRWVYQSENEKHKAIHGTELRGTKANAAKLTEADIKYIRENYKRVHPTKSNARELGAKLGVAKSTIVRIVNGKYWNHV